GPHVVAGLMLGDLHLGPGHQGRALGDVLDLVDQLLQIGAGVSADVEPGRRVVGYHVGRIATVGNDAVDTGLHADVLAQGIDAGEEFDHRIERVDAVIGIGGSVGG